jgi:hypothetical protein
VNNTGSLPHDLTVAELDATSGEIQAGSSGQLALTDVAPGENTLLCSIAGHEAAGMAGTLRVTDGATATTVAAEGAADPHADHGAMSPEEMARLHTEGVQAFPQETAGKGNQLLAPVMDGGATVFELTADEIEWETKQGVTKSGMAFNGQIPGPRIEALGDTIRIVVHNEMQSPTTLHPHGIILPNAHDGVPGIAQHPIMPGESFTYEFKLVNSGSHVPLALRLRGPGASRAPRGAHRP